MSCFGGGVEDGSARCQTLGSRRQPLPMGPRACGIPTARWRASGCHTP